HFRGAAAGGPVPRRALLVRARRAPQGFFRFLTPLDGDFRTTGRLSVFGMRVRSHLPFDAVGRGAVGPHRGRRRYERRCAAVVRRRAEKPAQGASADRRAARKRRSTRLRPGGELRETEAVARAGSRARPFGRGADLAVVRILEGPRSPTARRG